MAYAVHSQHYSWSTWKAFSMIFNTSPMYISSISSTVYNTRKFITSCIIFNCVCHLNNFFIIPQRLIGTISGYSPLSLRGKVWRNQGSRISRWNGEVVSLVRRLIIVAFFLSDVALVPESHCNPNTYDVTDSYLNNNNSIPWELLPPN